MSCKEWLMVPPDVPTARFVVDVDIYTSEDETTRESVEIEAALDCYGEVVEADLREAVRERLGKGAEFEVVEVKALRYANSKSKVREK